MSRLSTDVGGTFTDGVLLDEKTGEVEISKVSTTPKNPAEGTYNSIEKFRISLEDVSFLVHGTTVVINALIEESGAKAALITTEGFRDVLEIGRSNRTEMYQAIYKKPKPFVPRRLRFEVKERISKTGEVLCSLNVSDLECIITKIKEENVESVAVCLINAYVNASHEIAIGKYLKSKLPDVSISLSHQITRKYGEYERTSTAVLNAYVLPVVERYLEKLETKLIEQKYQERLQIMQSNGGLMTSIVAKKMPISMVESGPASGVIGAAKVAQLAGYKNAIAYDMGGTTAKAGIIRNGQPELAETYIVEGRPIRIPVIDLKEIGAGGGSLAWIDDVGALHVGPKSAGADPGPACYKRGGEKPCVTDANLYLGRLSSENFLGGEMEISPNLSEKALSDLASQLGLSAREMAIGILKIVNTNMAGLLHSITLQRGYDPRDFAMVAFGGSGPLHATSIAKELNIPTVIIPNHCGVFSAWGMIMADLRYEFSITHIERVDKLNVDAVNGKLNEIEKEILETFKLENVSEDNVEISYELDVRYYGQEHTLPIRIRRAIVEADKQIIAREFDDKHLTVYGHNGPDEPKEIASMKVIGLGEASKPVIRKLDKGPKEPDAVASKGTRQVYLDNGELVQVTVFDRSNLRAGNIIHGPAVVEEVTSTTFISIDQKCIVDEFGNLIITIY